MDETETCWHLLVTTEGGVVSILKNLDAPTARQAYQKLLPNRRPKEYVNQPENVTGWSAMGGWSTVSKAQVRSVDILGPDGVDLEPWRDVGPEIIDISHMIETRQFQPQYRT